MINSRDLHQIRCEDLLCPDYGGGTAWGAALARGDAAGARREFVRELRQGPSRFIPEISIVNLSRQASGKTIGQTGGHAYTADEVVDHIYHGVYGIVHQFRDGINWKLNPTDDWGEGRTVEWVVQMNRHYQWIVLADAYRETGDPRYANAWREELITWSQQQTFPQLHHTAYNDGWRNIEVGIRASWTWPYAFDVFRSAPEVSDDDVWLFVEKLFQHGYYVLQWPTTRNFKAMEGNGMAWAGLMLPELYHAPCFLSTALDRAIAEMGRQFLPDGCQDELAPSYAWVSIVNFYSTLMAVHEAFRRNPGNHGLSKRVSLDIPVPVWQRFDDLIRAVERIATPDGRMPPLNDSPASRCDRWREVLKLPVELEGKATDTPAGEWDVLPYGGYGVVRQDDEWALIDVGPHGTAHQHSDALQLLYYDAGANRLIDCNKPLYNASLRTKAIRSSLAHNVVQCNGSPHLPSPLIKKCVVPMPYVTGAVDGSHFIIAGRRFATISLVQDPDVPATGFSWTRLVGRIPGAGWLIVDWMAADDQAPAKWEWAWHWNPELAPQRQVLEDSDSAISFSDGYHLRVLTAASAPTRSRWISGVDGAQPRGWRVGVDQEYENVPVLLVESEPASGCTVGATWLLPQSQQSSATMPKLTLSATNSKWQLDVHHPKQPTTWTIDGDPFATVQLSLNDQPALGLTDFFPMQINH